MSYLYPPNTSTINSQRLNIRQVLETRAPDSVAIATPGRAPLTYGRLCTHIDDTMKTLNALGFAQIQSHVLDCLAILLIVADTAVYSYVGAWNIPYHFPVEFAMAFFAAQTAAVLYDRVRWRGSA